MPAESTTETHIYTVIESRLTIGGVEFPVLYAQLAMGVDELPSITLGIGVVTKDNPFISKLSLKKLSDTIEQLDYYVANKVKASLRLIVKDNNGVEERLEANDWIVTGAGLTRVTVKSSFSLECTITHPAYELVTTHAFAKFNTGVSDVDPSSVTDLVSAAKVALEALKQANEKNEIEPLGKSSVVLPTDIKSEDDVVKALTSGLDEAIKAINLFLEWDENYQELPGGSVANGNSEVADGVKYAMVAAWLQDLGGGSVFSVLQNVIRPYFFVETVPKYDDDGKLKDKLTLRPMLARKSDPDFVMSTNLVSSIDFPSRDREPVSGTYMRVQNAYSSSGAITFSKSSSENLTIKPEILAYIPKASSHHGVLSYVGDPSWISYAGTMGQSYSSQPDSNSKGPSGTYSPAANRLPAPAGQEGSPLDDWNDLRLKFLAQAFQIRYRCGVTAGISLPLSISLYLVPGDFVMVASPPDGDEKRRSNGIVNAYPLFKGKISHILHSINCENSSASTIIDLQYCECGDGYADDPVVGDRKPALYT